MTRNEFVRAVAEQGNFTIKNVKAVLDVMQDVAYENAREDEVVLFNGLILTSKLRAARTGRNPQTGGELVIPEKRLPKVKIGKAFKEAVSL